MKVGHYAAAAAAKSLQPCPTLCDPIDGSLLGSPIPGILQARILEWVAISFSMVLQGSPYYRFMFKETEPQRGKRLPQVFCSSKDEAKVKAPGVWTPRQPLSVALSLSW